MDVQLHSSDDAQVAEAVHFGGIRDRIRSRFRGRIFRVWLFESRRQESCLQETSFKFLQLKNKNSNNINNNYNNNSNNYNISNNNNNKNNNINKVLSSAEK